MNIVRDLMAPVDQCGSVHYQMTVLEAIRRLKRPRHRVHTQQGVFSYRALLVLDEENQAWARLAITT